MNLEDSYQRNKEVFNQLMHQSPIGIGIVNKKGDLIDCNRALENMLGYTRKEILEMNFEDFTHPEDLKRESPLIKEVWNGKRDRYQIKKRYFHKNGQVIWVELVGSVIRNKKGEPKLGFSFIKDITGRVKAKGELQRSKEYYRGVIEDQTELIVRWKANGILTFVNNSYCEFFNKSRDELVGKSFLSLIPEKDRHLIKENIEEITAENPIASHEHRVIKPDGTIGWTEWINRGIFNEKGELIEYQSVGRDITERRKTEQELRTARKRSEFYKDLLAHDIRNILNNIKLSMQLINLEKKDSQSHKKKKEAREIIMEQIKRGSSLISNVRAFSALDSQQQAIKSISIIKTLRNAIDDAKARFDSNKITIKTKLDENISDAKAGDMLIYAFENLILNGIIHNNKENRKVWINASKVQLNDAPYVKIEFIDNGVGISNQRKETIFHRTYDKENLKGGMGIGLSLVSRIIETYNGKIEVKNRIKGDHTKGSNFIVVLKEA